jgi:hypothetical protein
MVLIITAYYNRPQMVRNALESIANQTSDDYEVAFIDDGSTVPGRPIVEEILAKKIDKVRFYRIDDTEEQKRAQGGSVHGKYMNLAMEESNAEIGVILCDDDALFPTYVDKLIKYFAAHPEKNFCYSHVIPFDPTIHKPSLDLPRRPFHLNKVGAINPVCQVDSTQVAWRIPWVLQNNISFPYPMTSALDAAFYQQLYDKGGPCTFSGFMGQFKGVFADQLGHRKDDNFFHPEDIT